MSDGGVQAILAELSEMRRDMAAMKVEHSEDMAALGTRIDILTEAHKRCAGHCWVANQEQIKEALLRSGVALLSVPEEQTT